MNHPRRDLRQEPLYPLDGLTQAMKDCLLDVPPQGLLRVGQGYVGCSTQIHRTVVVNAVEELGLIRKFVIAGTAGPVRRAYLTAEGAWCVRSLRRAGT